MVSYPSVDEIIELNLLALTVIKVKKADSQKVLSKSKLHEIVEGCKNREGDIFDKAVVLLKGIVQKHAFASGNRRTALVVTKHFLTTNGHKLNIPGNPANARVMTGIREHYYTDAEIKGWIQHGKIKEFKR